MPGSLPSSTPASIPSRGGPADVREQIVASTVTLLWDHPLRDITVKMIMAGTDLSRPSFYLHFKSIPDLMEERLDELEKSLIEATVGWLTTADDDPQTLWRALHALVLVVEPNGVVFRAISEAATVDDRLAETWMRFMGQWDTAVAARIRVGQDAGYVKDIDPDLTAFALNRMNAEVLIESFGRRPVKDSESIARIIHQIWTSTLYAAR